LVVPGFVNKQVGGELGLGEITVKAHRGEVMQKMKASSFADLGNEIILPDNAGFHPDSNLLDRHNHNAFPPHSTGLRRVAKFVKLLKIK
jgi:Bacterial regulatory proteins, luxR family